MNWTKIIGLSATVAMLQSGVACAEADSFASDLNRYIDLSLPQLKKRHPNVDCEELKKSNTPIETRCSQKGLKLGKFNVTAVTEFLGDQANVSFIGVPVNSEKTYDSLAASMESMFYFPQERRIYGDPRLNVNDRNINPLRETSPLRETKWFHLIGGKRRTITLVEDTKGYKREESADAKPEYVVIRIGYPPQ